MQLLGHLAFPINLISIGLNDTGRNTLEYRGPVIWNFLNRSVRVPENFYSYKQILKKHAKDTAAFSFSKETTLITAKKDDFIYF